MTASTASIARLAEAARAGVDLIQIREPSLDDRSLLALVRSTVAAAGGTRARVLVNDRLDIALASGAAGVHLRGTSFSAVQARALAPDSFLIGRSVHTAVEAEQAQRQGGCDYLLFGTVFPSGSKPQGHPLAGVEALRLACRRATVPVLAIGGITGDTAREAVRAGAAGLAAIGVFSAPADLPVVIRKLRHSFDT